MHRARQLALRISAFLVIILSGHPSAWAKSFAYIGGDDGKVYVIDQASQQVTATVQVDSFCTASGMDIRKDGTKVYISSSCNGWVSILDTNTYEVITKASPIEDPGQMVLSLDESILYVVSAYGGKALYVLDAADLSTLDVIALGSNPQGIALSPDGSQLYVSNKGDSNIVVIDTASRQIVGSPIPTPAGETTLLFTRDGSKVYAAPLDFGNAIPDSVTVIDAQSQQVLGGIQVGSGAYGMEVSLDNSKLYVCNYDDNSLSVIDVANDTVMDTVPLNASPYGVNFTEDGQRLWITHHWSGSVAILDADSNAILSEISNLGSPNASGRFLGPELCGNGRLEDESAGEECDDGNAADGDGCSSACSLETPEVGSGDDEGQPAGSPTGGTAAAGLGNLQGGCSLSEKGPSKGGISLGALFTLSIFVFAVIRKRSGFAKY